MCLCRADAPWLAGAGRGSPLGLSTGSRVQRVSHSMDASAHVLQSSMSQRVPAPPAPVHSESAPASASKPNKKPRERWTPDEHARFLEGLKMYHRDWRSIEKHVGTKTAVQIRSHAQKFFAKAEREPGTVDFDLPPPRPKRKPGSSQQYGSGSKAGTSTPAQSSLNPTSSPPRVSVMPTWPTAGPDMRTLLAQPQPPAHSHQPAQLVQPPQHPVGPQHHVVSLDLMNKIAAAAIAAASTTAHAVISAAGPEYVNVIQDLAKRDKRLSFLSCPISELVSTFVVPPDPMPMECPQLPAFQVPGNALLAPSQGAYSAGAAFHPQAAFSAGGAMALVPSASYPSGSLSRPPCTSAMSEPPVQLLNRLLAVPASSQLVTEPDMSHQNDCQRMNSPGNALPMPPVTSGGLSENMFLPQLDDSMCLASAVPDGGTGGTPMATFTPPSDPTPSLAAATAHMPGVPAFIPPAGHVKSPEAHMQFFQQPGNGQVQSIQHAVPIDPHKAVMNEAQARQQVQEQQQHQQHVFPKQPQHAPEMAEGTNGYGEQGSGGGSRGGSGGGSRGEQHGSGDKSASKSAKQSGNRKMEKAAAAPPAEALAEPNPSQPLSFGTMANVNVLQGQGRLTAAQRTEFYKQYYQEMIRRGAEGLRNMNASADQHATPPAALQAAGATGANVGPAAGLPPAIAVASGKRSGSGKEGCAWSGRKKQRTADTPDVANVALSNGCEQPAAILGMLPCPPDTSIMPQEQGRVLEFHKGTGWAIEVEQQDTATSPQGASHGCTTQHDTSHRVHTSAQMPMPDAAKGTAVEGGNQPNSSGEGSNEPGVNGDDDPSGGAPQDDGPGENGQPTGKCAEIAAQEMMPVLSRGS
eukprot:jgi/Ulvmu1/7536/UM037_0080.1